MTTLIDGPAKGKTLMLGRAPVYLRVVHNLNSGKWDALDMPEDKAEPSEAIFLYRLKEITGAAMVDGRDSKGKRWGRRVVCASYELNPVQPIEDVMRDNASFVRWCEAHREDVKHLLE